MFEPYLLSPHVHVCVAGKHVVLLDLERDKYLAVVPAHRLARWVKGWPVMDPAGAAAGPVGDHRPDPQGGPPSLQQEAGAPDPAGEPLLSKMVSEGLLVTDEHLGKEAVPIVNDRPESTLLEFDLDTRPRATLAHLWSLAAAYATARSALRFRPMRAVVEAARERKLRWQHARGRDEDSFDDADLGSTRRLVSAFVHLRPLFYTAHDHCLLDSLALVNFLARYRIFPKWVFGVKAEPFASHCWVQQGGLVFNDAPDYVRLYTPILIV